MTSLKQPNKYRQTIWFCLKFQYHSRILVTLIRLQFKVCILIILLLTLLKLIMEHIRSAICSVNRNARLCHSLRWNYTQNYMWRTVGVHSCKRTWFQDHGQSIVVYLYTFQVSFSTMDSSEQLFNCLVSATWSVCIMIMDIIITCVPA